MTEQSSRKKTATGDKDLESTSVKNMLISGNQGESTKAPGSNQNNQGIINNTGLSSQGDLGTYKNPGINVLQGVSAYAKENPLIENQEANKDIGSSKKNYQNKNQILITEDLVEDNDSQKSIKRIDSNLLDVNDVFKQIPVMKGTPKKSKSQVKFIEQSNSDTQIINVVYLDTLRNEPPALEKDVVVIDGNGKFDKSVNLTNKNDVFKKVMELTMKADGYRVSKYSKIYEASGKNHDGKVRADGEVFDNIMWFFSGRTSNYKNHSYTPYFDRNIKELRYPIALTIFDNEWQSKAMGYHARKKVKSTEGDSKNENYTGLPYADEWLLDYGKWSIHYNGYINALMNARFVKFVEWSLAHKANVEKVMSMMGWLAS
ncbi:uncharacterized protein MELLADRAFT_68355 [Melampsora larici-populina 98AG31]|uniref:Uncharacterized protein n=1 Tax=Melampsora larici-populina (strain 98AG31 / pathotype 3-4-7) TaxID=747676 RepID=F4S6H8_MELLP|nr:uncharacterized protein MELLADRAFT_68355 [Melampsora larici-populina 98AG31]EGF99691.1 hypothetical protein MELLADRAFT_68355 [Melampsora larici-populina 98AG31]